MNTGNPTDNAESKEKLGQTRYAVLMQGLREKYGKKLYHLEESQPILIDYFRKKRGHIFNDPVFEILEEIVQGHLTNAETLGRDVEKYREIQNELEDLADTVNQIEIPKDIQNRVIRRCILLKKMYLPNKKYKCACEAIEEEK